MTPRELNRDYKRLAKRVIEWRDNDHSNHTEKQIRKELARLLNADREFKYVNKDSVLIFFALNQWLKVVPLHIQVLFDLKDIV